MPEYDGPVESTLDAEALKKAAGQLHYAEPRSDSERREYARRVITTYLRAAAPGVPGDEEGE